MSSALRQIILTLFYTCFLFELHLTASSLKQGHQQIIYAPVCPVFPTVSKDSGDSSLSEAEADLSIAEPPEGASSSGDLGETASRAPIRWMLMPDGRGDPQVAILSGAVPDEKDLPVENDINYLLYTRETGYIPEKRIMNESCMPKFDSFSPERPTVVLIHGFGDKPKESYMIPLLKDAYLARGDYNVLVVDWSRHAARPWYMNAVQNTQLVGRHLALLLDYLVDSAGARLDETHLVGFSLGAHVAGTAGSHLRTGKLSRITGLDPARVILEGRGPDMRLDPSDAMLVDVVHSSGGYLGFREPVGHRDFFPNGGQWPQPGCEHDYIWDFFSFRALPIVLVAAICSHRRAYYYFAEAIRHRGLPAVPCSFPDGVLTNSCKGPAVAFLGDEACKGPADCEPGIFYFETNKNSPFAKPHSVR